MARSALATPVDRDAPDAVVVADAELPLAVLDPVVELVPFKVTALALKAVKFLGPLSTALL